MYQFNLFMMTCLNWLFGFHFLARLHCTVNGIEISNFFETSIAHGGIYMWYKYIMNVANLDDIQQI